MAIKVGDKIPAATLNYKTADGIQKISTDELFKGKTVVLFGLPGAFTPTCSAKHLPGFVQHAKDIKAKGVDTIACLSVNDAWTMQAWADQHQVGDKIVMLADGAGAFAKALGIEFEPPHMGLRARRGVFTIVDGTVKTADLEAPGKLEVSSAEACVMKLG